MGRNYKKYPKNELSTRARMKKFVDCLNKAEIFNEKIPYLVIHQKERYFSSKLQIKLTFKENINEIITEKNCDKASEQFENYIIDKLNSISTLSVKKSFNNVFLEIIDSTDINCYKKYLVAYNFKIFNNVCYKNINNCFLIMKIYNKNIPLFKIVPNEEGSNN